MFKVDVPQHDHMIRISVYMDQISKGVLTQCIVAFLKLTIELTLREDLIGVFVNQITDEFLVILFVPSVLCVLS